MCSQMQARWLKKCVESLPKIFGLDDERRRMLNSSGWELNFGTQLVHNNLRMRSVNATENGLRHSKQTKRDEYEQGRKISKPPPTALPLSESGACITGMNTYSYSETVW
jgi:hypothetical protein